MIEDQGTIGSDQPVTKGEVFSWFFLSLGVVPTLIGLTTFSYQEYHRGLGFVEGLHSLSFIMDATYLSGIVVVWLAVWIPATYIFLWKRFSKNQKRYAAVMLTMTAVVSLLGMCVIPSSFFLRGRERAYAQLDTKRIAEACLALDGIRKTQHDPKKELLIGYGDTDLSALPPFLAQLNPAFVHADSRYVVVQMDGGGVAPHEGVFVPLFPIPEGPAAYAKRRGVRLLDAENRVFMYRLYDYSIVLSE
ncbi:MAG TPA: hypothetical protein VMV94_11580 [Phycisphaerae bacterium]|nr:hypothetical protein [Phycisphaerae bacterium]